MTAADPLASDDHFFAALIAGDRQTIAEILTDDFLLIDVMTGSEIPAAVFLEAVGSGQLVFEAIEPSGRQVRQYQGTAIVTGRTRMQGRYEQTAFEIQSRYTHVFISRQGRWRLATGQGTPIDSSPAQAA